MNASTFDSRLHCLYHFKPYLNRFLHDCFSSLQTIKVSIRIDHGSFSNAGASVEPAH